MHQSFVTTAPLPTTHLWGWAGDSGANVWGSDLLSSQAVPGKCDITQIYYKRAGLWLSAGPFTRALMDEKSLSPLFPIGGERGAGAVVTNDWWGGGVQWLQMTAV